MEALASTRVPEPNHPSGGVRRTELVRCTWTGLESLRGEIRSAIARHACRSVELDDVVQESLLRAARYRDSLVDPERLRAWVVRIAFNVLRDQMRRDMRLPRAERSEEVLDLVEGREGIPGDPCEDDVLEAEGAVFERDLVLRQLDRAFAELPRGDRRVLDAYYARGDGARPGCVREAASELFKVHVFRARGRLARALRKRLALGIHAEVPSRPKTTRKNRRGARCAPVRTLHVHGGAEGAAGSES